MTALQPTSAGHAGRPDPARPRPHQHRLRPRVHLRPAPGHGLHGPVRAAARRTAVDPALDRGQRVLDAADVYRAGNYVFMISGTLLLGFLGAVQLRLRRVDRSGVLATTAVVAGTLLVLIWPLGGVLHDVALETARSGADVRILAGWDAVAPYSPGVLRAAAHLLPRRPAARPPGRGRSVPARGHRRRLSRARSGRQRDAGDRRALPGARPGHARLRALGGRPGLALVAPAAARDRPVDARRPAVDHGGASGRTAWVRT